MKVIVTGAAGFIGSCLVWKLNQAGITDILAVDELSDAKWPNLLGKDFSDYLDKDAFLTRVLTDSLGKWDALVHLGACSSTTVTDAQYVLSVNYEYSKTLAEWALKNRVRFLYASSGATYGDGSLGFSDADETSRKLAPLNLYGFSKYLFDRWVIDRRLTDKVAGFKFFNVFGPNEYHKGEMRSVVAKSYERIQQDGRIVLFKSHRPDYKDGEQKRDFVYVKDIVEIMRWFLERPDKNGIFNLGTGRARTFNDLVGALFTALKLPPQIGYIDTPENIREKYQYFTQADISKLRAAGCAHQFMELEAAVADYAGYLKNNSYL